MKGIRTALLAATVTLALAAPVEAIPFTISGGTAGTIPGGTGANDFIPGLFAGPQIGGYYGAQILASFPVQHTIVLEFYGAEADFHNEFNFLGAERFDHPGGSIIAPSLGAPLATFVTTLSGAGILPFSFDVNSDVASLANGVNPDDSGGAVAGPNFFASCNPFGSAAGSGGTSCDRLYLFLDDGGGGSDDDHDDFLVRVTATPIPEAATLSLLGLGLLGLARRLRK